MKLLSLPRSAAAPASCSDRLLERRRAVKLFGPELPCLPVVLLEKWGACGRGRGSGTTARWGGRGERRLFLAVRL